METAHPRGCGADVGYASIPVTLSGSSPRVRGRPLTLLSRQIPHVGSSPRVRGRRQGIRTALAFQGLIPAGAGQTPVCFFHATNPRAHPRGCGADSAPQLAAAIDKGSSPRVRGRLRGTWRFRMSKGLIPAGAGQTPMISELAEVDVGSSPRVRGRHGHLCFGAGECGLIPAGAGQTSRRSPNSPTHPAHPRGCGADGHGSYDGTVKEGSSPRVRGRPAHRCRPRGLERLIPAGAGQTIASVAIVTTLRAHPRGCGADSAASQLARRAHGSSPRVRGRPLRGRDSDHAEGSSPRVRGRPVPSSQMISG